MKRVRVMFINCPTLSTDAAAFLLLSQNKVQHSMQFEVVHHWISGVDAPPKLTAFERAAGWIWERKPQWQWLDRHVRTRLDLRAAPYFMNVLTHAGWEDTIKTAVENYDKWFKLSGYKRWFKPDPVPTIVVTETPFEGGYLGYCGSDLAVVSLANWEGFFKPGSALEYILGSVQRNSRRLLYRNIGTHYATRGCVWDFNVHQPDARVAAYMGTLCSTCKDNLSKVASPAELLDAERLLSNDWIGLNDTPTSTSAYLHKIFGYPLRRSTGLHPGIVQSISQGMRTELGKFILDIVKVMLAALGTLYIASHFPDLYKAWIGK